MLMRQKLQLRLLMYASFSRYASSSLCTTGLANSSLCEIITTRLLALRKTLTERAVVLYILAHC